MSDERRSLPPYVPSAGPAGDSFVLELPIVNVRSRCAMETTVDEIAIN